MKKYLLHTFTICLMVSSLLISSCAENEPGKNTATAPGYDPTVPRYGGIHHRIRNHNWNTWDYATPPYIDDISLMGEELLGGDWSKGPESCDRVLTESGERIAYLVCS